MNRCANDKELVDIEILSWLNPAEPFSVIGGINNRFKLVLVEEGTGVLNIKERQEAFIAPTIFCFDELEKPKLSRGINLSARSLYFHPRIINSAFNFNLVRNIDKISNFTDRSNWQLLRPFFDKNTRYTGHLYMNGVNCKSMVYLLTAIQGELHNETDGYWLPRTRTMIFKLLILIQKVFYDYLKKERPTLPCMPEQFGIKMLEGVETQIPDSFEDIKKIVDYLNANFRSKITIDQLSKLFFMNRMTLNQRFSKANGMSIKHYLTILRIRAATFLLQNPTLCITDIPEYLGFYDSAHFYRIFRKYTGCSPSDYQQRYCI